MHLPSTVKKITAPMDEATVKDLRSGDQVLISGTIYTGRDAAHKRLIETLEKGEPLPLPIEGQVIFYVGPAPAKPGKPIGSAGPTTSYRMDAYTPKLLELGLAGMIGKGNRSAEVKEAMKKYGAVYFASIGGAAALTASAVKKSEIIAYEEMGPEAIAKLEVADFPAVVINDMYGGDLYEEGRKKYEIK
jgi:fumarate hydratase subunit beta